MTGLNQGKGYQNAPNISSQFGNFQSRISAGNQQGNLTGAEDKVLHGEMGNFRKDVRQDEASGMTPQDRQQLWGQANNINGSIYALRHNSLGSSAPPTQNGQPPALQEPAGMAAAGAASGANANAGAGAGAASGNSGCPSGGSGSGSGSGNGNGNGGFQGLQNGTTTGADGTTNVNLGGYDVSFNPSTGTSNITNAATGNGLQNWGDPHGQAIGPGAAGGATGNWSTANSTFDLPNGASVTEDAAAANGGLSSVTITGPEGKRQETISAAGVSYGNAQPQDQGDVYAPTSNQLTTWSGVDGNTL